MLKPALFFDWDGKGLLAVTSGRRVNDQPETVHIARYTVSRGAKRALGVKLGSPEGGVAMMGSGSPWMPQVPRYVLANLVAVRVYASLDLVWPDPLYIVGAYAPSPPYNEPRL